MSGPLEQIDVAWIGEALSADVDAVESLQLPFSGATTDLARLMVRYRDGGSGPATLVAKARGQDDLRQQVDAALGLFGREVRFYRELAVDVPVRVPRAVALGDGDHHPLVLEDLGALRLGDQAAGLSIADAERTLDALADLHAAFWGSPVLEKDWLCRPNEAVFCGMIAQLLQTGVPAFRERFAPGLDGAFVDAVCNAIEGWQQITDTFVEGPHTLAHNDCRLDNLFFAEDGTPIFIDWQTVASTRASQDFGNLLAGSLSADELSAHWERLLRRYHDRLVAGGVSTYSFDECILHYRQNIVYALGQGLALMGAFDYGDGRGVGDAILDRVIPHMLELDSFGALEGR